MIKFNELHLVYFDSIQFNKINFDWTLLNNIKSK